MQIDSSTIYGNVKFVHSQYSCILTSHLSIQVFFNKIIKKIDNFRIKFLSYSKITAILCVLYFLFLHFFYLILENMSTNVRKFCFPYYIKTLVTSCMICPFLCCHLLYLIIYLSKCHWK